jgi:hypothetical protein
MLASIFCALILAAWQLLQQVQSSPVDWNGEFSNIAYSGSLVVCVSQVDGQYLGQGLISERSYMRGIIYPNDSWVGEYWRAGGGIQGSFRLRLVDGGSSLATYSGELIRTNGQAARIYGFQTNYSKPTSDLCFQTDDSLMGSSATVATFRFTGSWVGWEITNSSTETLGLDASYTVTTLQVAAGAAQGSIYQPHVWGFQWTDAASTTSNTTTIGISGIGLAVASTSDALYLVMIPTHNGELIYPGLRRATVPRSAAGGYIAASGSSGGDSSALSTGLTVMISLLLALLLVALCCCYAGYCPKALLCQRKKDDEALHSQRPPHLPTVPPTAGTGLGPTITRVNAAPDQTAGGIVAVMCRTASATKTRIAALFINEKPESDEGSSHSGEDGPVADNTT